MKTLPVKLSETKDTVINWQNNLKQIIDGYRNYTSVQHALQKDAIQNSWDARIDKKKALSWKIEFELIENGAFTAFSFTDYGTTGLTGRILKAEELDQDLPVEERWGRFENVAFTKDPTEHALGARGRGKFIFVGSSKHTGKTQDDKKFENLILYDTRRPDGSYRFGFRTITKTQSPVQAYDNEAGEVKLGQFTENNLKPIRHVGTRIIIIDPMEELIESVKNSSFTDYIEETWWEIILHYKAQIIVKYNGVEKKAKLNKYFKFPEKDDKRFKIIRKLNLKLLNAPIYKILELVICYDSKGNIPEEIRGIAIQRGGMKICSVPIKYADKEIAESIYGYVKLDDKLEVIIQPDEGIEHYSFDFSKKIPRYLKMMIEDECAKFLREKLNIGKSASGPLPGEISAEKKAIYTVNKIAKKLGITGKGIVPPKEGEGGNGGEEKPIRLKFDKFIFPDNTILRVNYDQQIKNIQLFLINDTNQIIKTAVRFSIMYDDSEEIMTFINNENFAVEADKKIQVLSLDELIVTRSVFQLKGKYTFKAVLVSMEEGCEGDIIHKISKHFWVEEDPPQKGIFDDIAGIVFPPEEDYITGFSEKNTDNTSYKFYYHIKHPAKKAVEKDEGKLTNYLTELMCIELAWIDLRNPEQKLFKKEDIESNEKIVRKLTNFLGEVKHTIYYGSNS